MTDWQDQIYDFEERAGIMQFDAGLPRGEAEKLAYKEIYGISRAGDEDDDRQNSSSQIAATDSVNTGEYVSD